MQLAQSVERVPGQLSGDEASGHDPHAVTLGPMDLELLERRLADRGMPAYRADQVWEWTARGAGSYDEMTNLPAALRTELADLVPFSSLRLDQTARSVDGTEKALFATADGRPVEAVLMRYRDGRRSLCLSSQSGCPLTCTLLRHRRDALRPQPERLGDPRPGASLPPR